MNTYLILNLKGQHYQKQCSFLQGHILGGVWGWDIPPKYFWVGLRFLLIRKKNSTFSLKIMRSGWFLLWLMAHLLQFTFQMKRIFCSILDVIFVTNILDTLSQSKFVFHATVSPEHVYTPPNKISMCAPSSMLQIKCMQRMENIAD